MILFCLFLAILPCVFGRQDQPSNRLAHSIHDLVSVDVSSHRTLQRLGNAQDEDEFFPTRTEDNDGEINFNIGDSDSDSDGSLRHVIPIVLYVALVVSIVGYVCCDVVFPSHHNLARRQAERRSARIRRALSIAKLPPGDALKLRKEKLKTMFRDAGMTNQTEGESDANSTTKEKECGQNCSIGECQKDIVLDGRQEGQYEDDTSEDKRSGADSDAEYRSELTSISIPTGNSDDTCDQTKKECEPPSLPSVDETPIDLEIASITSASSHSNCGSAETFDNQQINSGQYYQDGDISTSGTSSSSSFSSSRKPGLDLTNIDDDENEAACIICMESYAAGDSIVTSNNPMCTHAYHLECLIEYFAYSPAFTLRGETPCPYCRQTYCLPTEESDDADDGGESAETQT